MMEQEDLVQQENELTMQLAQVDKAAPEPSTALSFAREHAHKLGSKRMVKTGSIDRLKAYDMRINKGMSLRAVARHLKCSPEAIRQAVSTVESIIGNPEDVHLETAIRPTLIAAVENKMLKALLDDSKVTHSSLRDIAMSFGQVNRAAHYDKLRNAAQAPVFNISLVLQKADKQLYPDAVDTQAVVVSEGEPTTNS